MLYPSLCLHLGTLALGVLNFVSATDPHLTQPNFVSAMNPHSTQPKIVDFPDHHNLAYGRRFRDILAKTSLQRFPNKKTSSATPAPSSRSHHRSPKKSRKQKKPPALYMRSSDSLLVPFSTEEPMSQYDRREHVVAPVRLHSSAQGHPVPTNKFYGNLLLGDSHSPVWTHPFGLRWDSTGDVQHGIAISHIDDEDKSIGPTVNGAAKFYLNPFMVSMGLSAVELDASHEMTVGNLTEFGCQVTLMPASEVEAGRRESPLRFIRAPLVRGMAYVTGIYQDVTPRIFSNVLIRTLTKDDSYSGSNGAHWTKYRFLIEDGVTWLLYAKSASDTPPLQLELKGNTQAVASGKFSGTIHIAKVPVGNDAAEAIYDASAGAYPVQGSLEIREQYIEGGGAAYKIDWSVAGEVNRPFLHFTLPHHRQVLTPLTKSTSIELPSTTKGDMVAYLGTSWHLLEAQRLQPDFLPKDWRQRVTSTQLDRIRTQTVKDISEIDFDGVSNLDSIYFSGKGIAKLALLCLVASDVLDDRQGLGEQCLSKLKTAYSRFMTNNQQNGLVYDTTWKGLISVQGLKEGALADFGNSWYNDHHYHYGYFVHAGAIIRHLDPSWETQKLRSFVQNLLRDVMNPSPQDRYFPTFRSFDWFMGHSWSQGIFVSADGKDEESTSEDINLYYAAGLWGAADQNPTLQHLSEAILTAARRTIQNYFLLENDNVNHPASFVTNHVTGILFENKVDHTTYFSPRIECIQGIQMIPATPALPMVRTKTFVREEWNKQLAPVVDSIQDGWRSILMMNRGMMDKADAWNYFASPDDVPLDDGMTRTWALFYVASLE